MPTRCSWEVRSGCRAEPAGLADSKGVSAEGCACSPAAVRLRAGQTLLTMQGPSQPLPFMQRLAALIPRPQLRSDNGRPVTGEPHPLTLCGRSRRRIRRP